MAYLSAQITVGDSTPALLWKTTTGTSPDPAIDQAGQIFGAGTPNDPVPIVVENEDPSNPVYLGDSAVTTGTGVELLPLSSLSFNVIGNDSLYAISGGSVVVGVMAGRQ